MAMKNGDTSTESKPHVMILPFPIVGRTNPMLQLSKRLSSKGVRVTLVTTPAFMSKLPSANSLPKSSPSLTVAAISDDFNDAPPDTVDLLDYWKRFAEVAPKSLAMLMREQESQDNPVKCLVYDSLFTWALDLAKDLGIYAAPFFPQSCAVSLIYCHVFKGVLAAPPAMPIGGCGVLAPGLPVMGVGDLPTIVQDLGKEPILEFHIFNQFKNFEHVDWLFFNTFHALEKEVLNWMSMHWLKATPVGPTIPSMYLDNRLEDDKDYGLSHINPEIETWSQWLETKEDKSTIYVSFGSMGSLGEEQMEELVLGLKGTNKPFLWVVKTTDEGKLPPNFRERVLDQGKVVGWCPQLAVLAHRAVGCFFTHCGWNSTVEAVSLGVPMVGMPQWLDQPTNAMFVENVWRVGIRVKADEKGIVRGEEITRCVMEVMEGEKGEEMGRNAEKWELRAKEAMEEGGSSDRNLEDFVSKIRG